MRERVNSEASMSYGLVRNLASLLVVASFEVLALGSSLASADVVSPNVLTKATKESFAELNRLCKVSLGFNNSDSVAELKFHKIYRTGDNCRDGKRESVCEAYVYNTARSRCVGKFLVGSSIVLVDISISELNERVKNDYDLPANITFGKNFGIPFVAESTQGEVLLLESANKFYIQPTE